MAGTELAPEILDEIVLRVAHVGGQPNLVMQMRRTVFMENGILLGTPRHEPLPESYAIDIALNVVRQASISAIQFKESQGGLVTPAELRG